MKIHIGLVIAAAVAWSISGATAFAKTAKECTQEWRADKAGMQARGVTEKAYVEQCKGGGAEPTAAAPAVKPAETASPRRPGNRRPLARKPQKTVPPSGERTRPECKPVASPKGYVEQCKTGGVMPNATAPEPKPTVAAPTPPPSRPHQPQPKRRQLLRHKSRLPQQPPHRLQRNNPPRPEAAQL